MPVQLHNRISNDELKAVRWRKASRVMTISFINISLSPRRNRRGHVVSGVYALDVSGRVYRRMNAITQISVKLRDVCLTALYVRPRWTGCLNIAGVLPESRQCCV